jgi:replicative DNA helicase
MIAGRPGKGKTTMALNEVLHNGLNGIPGLVISIEMSKDEIIAKLISDLAGLNLKDFELGRATYADIQRFKLAGNVIEKLPIYIVDGNFTIEQICSTVREHVEKHGIKYVVIDYVQIISPSPGKKFQNRNAEVSYMSQQLIALGNDTKAHLIVVSQLSRSYKTDEPPELHHLRDSGALEQDAYMVIFVYEDPDAEGDFPDYTPSIMKVAKNRGGEVGEVRMRFNKKHSRFIGNDNQYYRLEDYVHLLHEEEEEPEEGDTPF